MALDPKFDPVIMPVVYYAQLGHKPIVKIGTTTNLRLRMAALSTAKRPAECLAIEPGSYYLEKKRHAQFEHLALGDETFKFTSELKMHIDAVRQDTAWVPPPLGNNHRHQWPPGSIRTTPTTQFLRVGGGSGPASTHLNLWLDPEELREVVHVGAELKMDLHDTCQALVREALAARKRQKKGRS